VDKHSNEYHFSTTERKITEKVISNQGAERKKRTKIARSPQIAKLVKTCDAKLWV
jgi:hypothetical protein